MEPVSYAKVNPLEGGVTFAFRNRLVRAMWVFVWGSLGIWTPVLLHPWRRFLVRLFGGNISPTARIYPWVKIRFPPNLKMDAFSCLGPGAFCYNTAQITLSHHVVVSQRAHLCSGTHDIDDPSFRIQARAILIQPGAWIAAEAFVGPGVVVGEGAVLGARGVAAKNLSPWTVYAGNPARQLRLRVCPREKEGR